MNTVTALIVAGLGSVTSIGGVVLTRVGEKRSVKREQQTAEMQERRRSPGWIDEVNLILIEEAKGGEIHRIERAASTSEAAHLMQEVKALGRGGPNNDH
ncbi:hypothetical protein [Streptomyces sp. NPDC007905]|uniref:hypothetical protein n=1 Tax=Streptomyces sp. NPDC007905 TaxID=3364788 RepID=UPI0036E829C4